ncbi:hypothetical protein FGLOB1_6254 [Fusarium globosum]|uniref:Uncharacterized protein n=1 Tax=Fusarium globosum TaxID=78864 RepID=A0A8H5YCF0_9HYPO|nr:hypothetical protein FGLOB1_6254 [Fusarium globosum]
MHPSDSQPQVHGVVKATVPHRPAPNQRAASAAAGGQGLGNQQAETPVNDGDSNMTGVEGSDPQPGPSRGGFQASRGGHAGRGRGGAHFGRGRGSHNNNQTGRRSGTASSNMEPQCLPPATASEVTWVADSQGHKAAKIVNRTPGGGNSHAFSQIRPYNQRWGITPGYGLEEDAKELLRKAGPGYTRVMYQLVAVSEEHFNAVSRNAVEKSIEDHNGKNVEGKNALLFRGWVDPHPKEDEEEDEEEEIKCKVCGNPNHTVSTCFSHTGKGQTFGCPLCDAADHTGSDCAEIAKLSLTEQVKLLITNRGNMPAFHEGPKKKSWWKLLHKFCMSAEYDQELLGELPWGRGFVGKLLKKGQDLTELQKQYDEKPGFPLPPDPSTATLERIGEKWRGQGLPWPREALGDLPERPKKRRQGGDDKTMEDAAPAVEPPAEPEAAASTAADTVAEPATGPAPPTATTNVADPANGQDVSTAAGTVAEPATGLDAASAPSSPVVAHGPSEEMMLDDEDSGEDSVSEKSKEDQDKNDDSDLIDYSDDEL